MSLEYSIDPYILNPQHPITVLVIGAGGNGSLLLTHLARLHLSLIALEHPGLHVTVMDNKVVTEANVGRQAFSIHDIGKNKARVAVSRINMFYGLSWKFIDQSFTKSSTSAYNIIATCTDQIESRKAVYDLLKKSKKTTTLRKDQYSLMYWLDLGNRKNTGQVVLASYDLILKSVIDLFKKDYQNPDSEDEPSCSLVIALQKQDLCINPMMAVFAQKILWDMFTRRTLNHHGFIINLDTLIFNTIPI